MIVFNFFMDHRHRFTPNLPVIFFIRIYLLWSFWYKNLYFKIFCRWNYFMLVYLSGSMFRYKHFNRNIFIRFDIFVFPRFNYLLFLSFKGSLNLRGTGNVLFGTFFNLMTRLRDFQWHIHWFYALILFLIL